MLGGVIGWGVEGLVTSDYGKYNFKISLLQDDVVELLGSDDSRGEVSGMCKLLESRHLKNLLDSPALLGLGHVVVGIVDRVAVKRLLNNFLVKVVDQLDVEVVGTERDGFAFGTV